MYVITMYLYDLIIELGCVLHFFMSIDTPFFYVKNELFSQVSAFSDLAAVGKYFKNRT